ncbi:MAG: MFS transporter [Alphaproteobacteria bacterium]|nr:MFS transporter [Alphaproteobacteria bacterium]
MRSDARFAISPKHAQLGPCVSDHGPFVSQPTKPSVFSPFTVPSFRFQWPADLLNSWAFEMETLILGWFILVETESVLALTIFGSMQFIGTLVAPILGVLGDRLGRRTVLCVMRAMYSMLAAILMVFALNDSLTPAHVFVIAFFSGLVRPSDLVMRNGLIGDTMPSRLLMSGMGVSRTMMDSARIAGALIGAGLFSQFGIGPAYIVITAFHVLSFVLTFGVSKVRGTGIDGAGSKASPWRDTMRGFGYVWTTPMILAAMWLAFLVNVTVFPISHGILPYVAKEIYLVDENGLSHLVASYAGGALLGSLTMTVLGGWRRPGRFMIINIWLMHLALLGFGLIDGKLGGQGFLFLTGYLQSLSMIAMAVTLLASAEVQYRGLVMGVRMLAVYGLPIGLMGAGYLIETIGFPVTVAIYSVTGLVASAWIAYRWRREIWHGVRDDV